MSSEYQIKNKNNEDHHYAYSYVHSVGILPVSLNAKLIHKLLT